MEEFLLVNVTDAPSYLVAYLRKLVIDMLLAILR